MLISSIIIRRYTMTDDRILKRSEVKKENTWATEDMFPSDQAWSEE